jgi:hypothetical protein
VIDLAGNGIRFGGLENGVVFPINAFGTTLRLGWPEAADDVWLAMDRNGNSIIEDGSELFGNTSVLESGQFAANGYEALRDLDENADGAVDSADKDFSRLRVWSDANRNGVAEAAEVRSLSAVGISGLSLEYWESSRRDRWGNRFVFVSYALLNGRRVRVATADVYPVACWR